MLMAASGCHLCCCVVFIQVVSLLNTLLSVLYDIVLGATEASVVMHKKAHYAGKMHVHTWYDIIYFHDTHRSQIYSYFEN